MSPRTSWQWSDAPKPVRRAEVTIPWTVWGALNEQFPEESRVCGGSAREFSGDRIGHVVLFVRESFLPQLLTMCDVIEKRLGVPGPPKGELPF